MGKILVAIGVKVAALLVVATASTGALVATGHMPTTVRHELATAAAHIGIKVPRKADEPKGDHFKVAGTVTSVSGTATAGSLTISVKKFSHSLESCGVTKGSSLTISWDAKTKFSPHKLFEDAGFPGILSGKTVKAGGKIERSSAGVCTLDARKINVHKIKTDARPDRPKPKAHERTHKGDHPAKVRPDDATKPPRADKPHEEHKAGTKPGHRNGDGHR
jgi:hypothetical protein